MSGQAINARCTKCDHVWEIARLPMPLDAVARCMKNATCPRCGDTKPVLA